MINARLLLLSNIAVRGHISRKLIVLSRPNSRTTNTPLRVISPQRIVCVSSAGGHRKQKESQSPTVLYLQHTLSNSNPTKEKKRSF